jgi:DNA-binding GntR family transcriptional regulator
VGEEITTGQLPAAERAYAFTKELIISGELPGGHLFSEGEIAERTGMSRTPVREAFLRLQAERLLELYPKRGAVVVPISPGEARDVLDLREALECSAVRRIIRSGLPLPPLARHLGEIINEQRRLAEAIDPAGFSRADQEFHQAIVAASGNALAEQLYLTLYDRQRRMAVHALRPRPDLLSVLADEHAALVRRISERDEAGFSEALRPHMEATYRTMLSGTGSVPA